MKVIAILPRTLLENVLVNTIEMKYRRYNLLCTLLAWSKPPTADGKGVEGPGYVTKSQFIHSFCYHWRVHGYSPGGHEKAGISSY